jgi:hypothetical protein
MLSRRGVVHFYVDTLKFNRQADAGTLRNYYHAFLDYPPPITSSNWREEKEA